ncbi:PEP-CTERM sorting domain-containing protein [Nostoc sp.]|uniref:PEP-CTERM sorting domain-containing protein n=1 Tax=Nostoc sp. TaxID=1180 RepID=UPI00359313E7
MKFKAFCNIGFATLLAVSASTLNFQSAALAWKITRTGRDLPANQTLNIGGTNFSCNGSYGFIPGAILENAGRTSTVLLDRPFCFPYSPETRINSTQVFPLFETTTQGVKAGLRFFDSAFYLGGTSEYTDKWTLEGYIEQVSLGNGLYRKNVFLGEGTEQTNVISPDPYNFSSSGSIGIPIGSGPYSTSFSIDSEYSTDLPSALDYTLLWSPATRQYLMQPHYGSYSPSGNVVADSAYYKFSSYIQKEGEGGKGIVPVVPENKDTDPRATIVAEFDTEPSKSKIYTKEGELNYLYEGIATPEEVSILPKLSSLKAYDPKEIINNTKLKDPLSEENTRIRFNFVPKTNDDIPIQLGTLAKALGYEYFNYLQIISDVPESLTWWDGNGKRVAYNGEIKTSKGTGAFFDALPGGNLIVSYNKSELNENEQKLVSSIQLSPEEFASLKKSGINWVPADTQPFYLDVPGYGGFDEEYKEFSAYHNVSMTDRPVLGNNPKNESIIFHTLLVGVKDGGATFHAFDGLSKKWSSNTTCALSGCTGGIFKTSSSSLPEFTTGGIEILDDSVSFDELSDDIIALLKSFGGKLINTDGSEYIRNSNTTTVPEPSFVLGLIAAIGIGTTFKYKRKR